MKMPGYTLVSGCVLVLLGVGGYLGTGARSVTALIPAFAGIPLVILGVVAMKGSERSRKHAMHAAVALALLGFAGAARGLAGLAAMLAGGDVQRPTAIVMQSLMALVCAAFVALGVQSFLAARARRKRGHSTL
jgi:hypothetical protein